MRKAVAKVLGGTTSRATGKEQVQDKQQQQQQQQSDRPKGAVKTQQQPQVKPHTKMTPDEAALTAKNYRLAKELSELRVRHREECKTVRKLTMENMALASKCRDAMAEAVTAKRELDLHKRTMSDMNHLKKTITTIEPIKYMTGKQEEKVDPDTACVVRPGLVSSDDFEEDIGDLTISLDSSFDSSPPRSPLRVEISKDESSLTPLANKSPNTLVPPSNYSPDPADTSKEENDKVAEAMSSKLNTSGASRRFFPASSPTRSMGGYNEEFPGDITSDSIRSSQIQQFSHLGSFDESPDLELDDDSSMRSGSDDAIQPPPEIKKQQEAPGVAGEDLCQNGRGLSSIDAFEASFQTDFSKSFSPREEAKPETEIYNPFSSSPTARSVDVNPNAATGMEDMPPAPDFRSQDATQDEKKNANALNSDSTNATDSTSPSSTASNTSSQGNSIKERAVAAHRKAGVTRRSGDPPGRDKTSTRRRGPLGAQGKVLRSAHVGTLDDGTSIASISQASSFDSRSVSPNEVHEPSQKGPLKNIAYGTLKAFTSGCASEDAVVVPSPVRRVISSDIQDEPAEGEQSLSSKHVQSSIPGQCPTDTSARENSKPVRTETHDDSQTTQSKGVASTNHGKVLQLSPPRVKELSSPLPTKVTEKPPSPSGEASSAFQSLRKFRRNWKDSEPSTMTPSRVSPGTSSDRDTLAIASDRPVVPVSSRPSWVFGDNLPESSLPVHISNPPAPTIQDVTPQSSSPLRIKAIYNERAEGGRPSMVSNERNLNSQEKSAQPQSRNWTSVGIEPSEPPVGYVSSQTTSRLSWARSNSAPSSSFGGGDRFKPTVKAMQSSGASPGRLSQSVRSRPGISSWLKTEEATSKFPLGSNGGGEFQTPPKEVLTSRPWSRGGSVENRIGQWHRGGLGDRQVSTSSNSKGEMDGENPFHTPSPKAQISKYPVTEPTARGAKNIDNQSSGFYTPSPPSLRPPRAVTEPPRPQKLSSGDSARERYEKALRSGPVVDAPGSVASSSTVSRSGSIKAMAAAFETKPATVTSFHSAASDSEVSEGDIPMRTSSIKRRGIDEAASPVPPDIPGRITVSGFLPRREAVAWE